MKKVLLGIGIAGLASLFTNPAMAQTFVSGRSQIILMNGASQSVGVEITIPAGTYFTGTNGNGAVTVTPILANPAAGLSVNQQSFLGLVVDPGLPDAVSNLTGGVSTTFSGAAAAQLDAAMDLDAITSIIRAGAGVDGLD